MHLIIDHMLKNIDYLNMRRVLMFVKYGLFSVAGLFTFLVMWGIAGYDLPISDTEITQEEPFAKFVGREYRLKVSTEAMFWNDFPDKEKILTVSIGPASAKNRFVTKIVSLADGQKIRIMSAWSYFTLEGFKKYYMVSFPDLDFGVPAGVPIRLNVKSDGIPDPLLYEPISD